VAITGNPLVLNHSKMVQVGFKKLYEHLSHSMKHELTHGIHAVFPTGERDAVPVVKSAIGVFPVGSKRVAGVFSANDFVNSKPVFLGFKPIPFPRATSLRVVGQFYSPNNTDADGEIPSNVKFNLAGTLCTSVEGGNPTNLTNRFIRTRGVFSHYNLAYQGPLSTATGSLYIYIPQDGALNVNDTSDLSMNFQGIFGESDILQPATGSLANSGAYSEKGKKYIITLAKLAELGSISFTIYNERVQDYIFQEPIDSPADILLENPNSVSSLSGVVNFMFYCDSTTNADRVRVVASQHHDVVYSHTANVSIGLNDRNLQQYVPPNHINMIPEIVNSTHCVIPHHESGSLQRQAHALHTAASMAQGQAMDIGTLSTEEEMDVGHPSFGSVKKAAKAAWNTEQTDNEYYGAVVAGQPEVAAYAAPVVEPAIAAHAVYNFFRTNK